MRRKDREITDLAEMLTIIDSQKILHLGLNSDGYPYVVPLHFGFELPEGERLPVFYMHGASEGKKLDLIRKDGRVCIEIDSDIETISGGDIPCRYGASYRSVMIFGKAAIVEDPKEKVLGLTLLMEHQTGKKFEITEKMAETTSVIKVTTELMTGKARQKNH